MHKNKFFSYFLVVTGFAMLLSLPLQACDRCDSLGITAEARVAYYHPSSSKVRRIYGSGWADYQIEISKGFRGFGNLFGGFENSGVCGECACEDSELEWRIWAGVSGFSRKGDSINFHDDTKLQLIPINLGLKVFYPFNCNTKFFIGGAACYSLLRIRDHNEYVHEHTHKENWGGLIQSGITYEYCDWLVVSAFADYYFQRFHFHDTRYSSFYGSTYYYDERFIERYTLNMSGYKIGVGLGITF